MTEYNPTKTYVPIAKLEYPGNNISPNHYKLFATDNRKAKELEALDVIKASLTEEEFNGYLKGNQLKYLLRHKNKNGEEDLRKAKKYAEFYENKGIHVQG